MTSFDIIKQLYNNQLTNKNEGTLSNKSTDWILDLDEKTDNSSIIKKNKEKECNMPNKLGTKKDEAYKIRSNNNCSLGKHFYYKNTNNVSSVPCPVSGCDCGNFSEIFDRYDDNVKISILTQGNKKNVVKVVDWSYDDWKYPVGTENVYSFRFIQQNLPW